MRAALYARFSSELQAARSVDDQLRLCRAHAATIGATVTAEYSDAAISGAATVNRPGLQDLLAAGAGGTVDVVIAEALDRLSRNQEHIAGIFNRLAFAGVRVVTVSEGEISELHVGLKGTMNALFLKDLGDKVRRGQAGRAADGSIPGGLCYGYRLLPGADARGNPIRGRREIDPDQAAIVRRIFTEYAAGLSGREIAAGLNADGVPAPRGGEWGASAINGNRARRSGILHNELYVGRLVYNRQRFVKNPDDGKRQARPNPPDQWISADVPDLRIIDAALWAKVTGRKAKYAGMTGARARRPRRLLSGLLRCGPCGGAMTIGKPGRYVCVAHRERGTCDSNRSVSVDDLEDAVLAGLRDRLLQSDAVAAFVRDYHAERTRLAAAGRARGDESRAALRRLDGKIARLAAAIADGTDTPATRALLLELEGGRPGLAAAAGAAAGDVVTLHPNIAEVYRRRVDGLAATLSGSATDRAAASEALRGLIDAVVFWPGEKRGEATAEICGDPAAMLAFAGGDDAGRMISVVAGAGLPRNHPFTATVELRAAG